MTPPFFRMLAILASASSLCGCGASAPSRFYTLSATARADGTPATACAVLVGPVTIPAAVDRPQFVVQIAPNRVDIDEFNRWVAPLADAISRTVAADLATLLGTPDVAAWPLANFAPAYRVTIDVQRFESLRLQAAVLDAVWTVQRATDGSTRVGRTATREPVGDDSFDALAAAHSRALATMSADIAAAIRADAAAR
ncbi:PqiC family protein [Candidatus Binatia bacterium]|nr:PqiC family protein [Candidatus Binatia bacterium]